MKWTELITVQISTFSIVNITVLCILTIYKSIYYLSINLLFFLSEKWQKITINGFTKN